MWQSCFFFFPHVLERKGERGKIKCLSSIDWQSASTVMFDVQKKETVSRLFDIPHRNQVQRIWTQLCSVSLSFLFLVFTSCFISMFLWLKSVTGFVASFIWSWSFMLENYYLKVDMLMLLHKCKVAAIMS